MGVLAADAQRCPTSRACGRGWRTARCRWSPPITAHSSTMARQPIVYEGQPVAIPGKELGTDDFTKIPNGLPGVGDRLPILWTLWGAQPDG